MGTPLLLSYSFRFSVHVTSHPDKIYDALDASVAVLRDVSVSADRTRRKGWGG
jgi:hypothetical protein